MPKKFTRIQRVCRNCGTEFAPEPHDVARGYGFYCSHPCFVAHKYPTDTASVLARFDRFVDKSGECWEWTGGTDKRGYGIFSVAGKATRATRFVWTAENGPIPDGQYVCHRCDNPACVRVSHLFLHTPAGNSADMVAKGRQLKGERQSRAKLTADQVRQIREKYVPKSRESGTKAMAKEYGVSDVLVSLIVRRKIWQDV